MLRALCVKPRWTSGGYAWGMTARRYQRTLEVLSKRQPDLSILAENVHKPHNLSAMLRSCDAVGIGKVYALNPTGGVPTYNETSASAEKWVELAVYAGLEPALAEVRRQGMQVLAAHLSAEAIDYRDMDYTRPTCIILGNEKQGVSERAANAADGHIIIPMLGMVQSLNVSVATAVILFEAHRQRREAGFYDASRLSQSDIERQAFRWLHPREAEGLEAAGAPFPPLDEDGGIIAAKER